MHDADDCGIAKLYVCLYSPPFVCVRVCIYTNTTTYSIALFICLFIYLDLNK